MADEWGQSIRVNDVYLEQVRGAMLAVQEFVESCCVADEYLGDLDGIKPDHLASLLSIINRHLRLAIELPDECLSVRDKL